MHEKEEWKWSHSVMSDSSWPHGLQPTRLLCPWIFQARVLEWGAIAFSDRCILHTYFSLSKIFFNWSIIALQCCAGIYHTSIWISHRYAYVPLLLNIQPHPTTLRSSQSTMLSSLRYRVNSNWLSLLHKVISMLHATLSVQPTRSFPCCVHKSVLSVWVSHCCPANKFTGTFF